MLEAMVHGATEPSANRKVNFKGEGYNSIKYSSKGSHEVGSNKQDTGYGDKLFQIRKCMIDSNRSLLSYL